ncbi:MAG: hypothetical protein ACKOOF_12810 [Planctomycetaceae bacterium]
MTSTSASFDPLARLVSTLESSPAMYLADSGLASYPGAAEIRTAIEALVTEQKDVLARAAAIIENREQPLPQGAFPIAFTAWHDVDLRHLAARVVESLKRQASDFGALAGASGDAAASDLAGRAQEIARRHAERIEGLLVRLRAGLAGQSA